MSDIKMPSSVSVWMFAASLVMAPLSDIRVTGHLSVCDVLLVAAAFFAVAERVIMREHIPIHRVYLGVIVVYTLLFLIGALETGFRYWQSFAVILIAGGLTPMAVGMMRVKSLSEFNFLLAAWTLGGLIGVFFILGFCNGFFPSHADIYWHYHDRARGLTLHPNLSGVGALLTLPGLFILFSSSKRLPVRVVALLLVLATLKAIDYTGARSSFVALMIFVVVWLSLSAVSLRKQGGASKGLVLNWVFFAFVGLLLLSVYIAAGGGFDLLSGVWDRLAGNDFYARQSDAIRENLSQNAWKGFWTSPLIGQGYEWTAFTTPKVAHNMYLQYLQALGILGFLAFITTLLYPLAYPLRTFLQGADDAVSKINNSILAAMAAVLAWLYVQSGFADYEPVLIFCLPLILRAGRLYENAQKPNPAR